MDIDVPEPLDHPGLIDYFDPELTGPYAHISIGSVHPRICQTDLTDPDQTDPDLTDPDLTDPDLLG
jgi:hypothetical protein